MKPKVFKIRITDDTEILNLLIKADSVSEATNLGKAQLRTYYPTFRILETLELEHKEKKSSLVYDQSKLFGNAKWRFLAKKECVDVS